MREMMEELLKMLLVLQERKVPVYPNIKRIETRLNPYNPLSYILLIVEIVLTLLLKGILGVRDMYLYRNPFKYE